MDPNNLAKAMNISLKRAAAWADTIEEAFEIAGLTTLWQRAYFIAQVGHESSGLGILRELWGPTAAQSKYDMHPSLGNRKPGDGKRYMGRGPIQVTGLANYERTTKSMRELFPDCPDFVENPDELLEPKWGMRAAALFWRDNNLTHITDFTVLTRRINGGTTGIVERKARLRVAMAQPSLK
jgi:putative chitinase